MTTAERSRTLSPRKRWPVYRYLLGVGLAALAGTGAFLYLSAHVIGVLLIGAGVLTLVLLCLRSRWRIFPVFLILFILLGYRYDRQVVRPLTDCIGRTDHIVAKVVDHPSECGYTVKIMDADVLKRGQKALLYCDDRHAPALEDTVEVTVKWNHLSNTQRSYMADSVFLAGRPVDAEQEDCVQITPATKYGLLSRCRRSLRAALQNTLRSEAGDLLAAVCLGYKDALTDTVIRDFRRCGLPHLLVVSGLHLSIVAVVLRRLLDAVQLRKRLAALLTIAGVLGFMALVGFSASVVRAGLMCLIILTGDVFRRRADGLNSMGLALTILLAVNPYAVYDAGMWLSFAATGGVLCFAPTIRGQLYDRYTPARTVPMALWRWFADNLSVTLGATLTTVPILVLIYGEIAWLSLPANLLTVGPAGWMLSAGVVGMLCGQVPFLCAVRDVLLLFAGLLARYIRFVTEILSALPFAVSKIQSMWAYWCVVCACLFFMAILACRSAHLRRSLLAGIMVILVLTCTIGTVFSRHWTTITLTDTKAPSFLAKNGRTSLVVTGDGSDLPRLSYWLSLCGVDRIDILVVTACDSTQVGYITELTREHPTAAVYYTDTVTANAGLPPSSGTLTEKLELVTRDGMILRMYPLYLTLTVENSRFQLNHPDRSIMLNGRPYLQRSTGDVRLYTAGGGEWSDST